MTTLSPDALDQVLSDFFRSKVKDPWPACPVPPSAVAEPAAVVAARNAADSGNRARYTLAASVALLLGTCWYLSGGSHPGSVGRGKPAPGGPDVLGNGMAKTPRDFTDPADKAKKTADPMSGFQPGPITLP